MSATSADARAGRLPGPGRQALSGWFIAILCVTAWSVLFAWSGTPYGRFLVHDGWLDTGIFAALCRAVPQGGGVVPAALHALAWVVMIAAVMFAPTVPLPDTLHRVVSGRP